MRPDGLKHEETHRGFVDRVRKRAEKKGVSMEALADDCGISRRHMWRILGGQSSPTLEVIAGLARSLECRPKDLLP